MRLSKSLAAMVIVTVMALIYIHLQVQIYDLAYRGSAQESQISQLMDDRDDIHYDITVLKSANHLGGTLLSGDSDLRFLDRDDIIEVHVPRSPRAIDMASLSSQRKERSFLARLFSLKSKAEAKTIE